MTDLERLRLDLLDAREGRARLIANMAGPSPDRRGHGSLIFVSTNVPGAEKRPFPLDVVVNRTVLAALRLIPASFLVRRGADPLGPFAVLLADASPIATKLSTIRLEEEMPWGRLVDLDVYDEGERQVDRGSLGLAPRPCFVCREPAHECMRAGRHPAVALQRAVARLLAMASADAHEAAHAPSTPAIDGRTMGRALTAAARAELDLTPKPGLVDGRDSGSHPDLTYDKMRRSIDLLPRYFDELVEIATACPTGEGVPVVTATAAAGAGGRGFGPAISWPQFDLAACVEAGRRAEARMLAEVGSNAHRGLIFLGGLSVLAACPSIPASVTELRTRIALLAGLLVGGQPPSRTTHGGLARQGYRVGGIQQEALRGLPAVFEQALPLFQRLASGPRPASDHAPFAAMAALMQHVEDTTAVHRCGMTGLARLREDGAALLRAIERGDDPRPQLVQLNDRYRDMRLTMGGVADCLAMTFAMGFLLPRTAGPR